MMASVKKSIALLFLVLLQFVFVPVPKAYAATSPTLGTVGSYSVLGGQTVTNTGSTTIVGDVGVSPGSAITGFPPGIISWPGELRSVPDSALAQLANTTAYLSLSAGNNAACTETYADTTDLTAAVIPGVVNPGEFPPGVYCSLGSFQMSGNITLTGNGVWVFRTVSGLTTAPGSSVTGGDPCNVWWRIGSSAALDTTTSFIGNILASTSISLATGATLNGRALAQTGSVTLDANTINSACLTSATRLLTSQGAPSSPYCEDISEQIVSPSIIESRRIDADSVFLSWGPYSGSNTFNVRYGTVKGEWLYNTNVTGFSTTINNLPANTPIWVEVAVRSDCTIGDYGPIKLVGGPGLPNTGFAPGENNILLYISAGIFTLSLLLLKLKYL